MQKTRNRKPGQNHKWLAAFLCAAFIMFTSGRARALVAVDAGHGGYDEGIIYNAGGKETSEKNVDLELSRAITAALRAKGAAVFSVRPVDRYLGIAERARLAAAKKPDLFLSVHLSSTDSFKVYMTLMRNVQIAPPAVKNPPANINPSISPDITGGQAQTANKQVVPGGQVVTGGQGAAPDAAELKRFYEYSKKQRPWLGQSRDFATKLEQSIQQAFPGKNIAYMEIPLPLLDAIAAPAVLIECPAPQYMDYADPSVVSSIAQAVANAAAAYGK